MMRARGRRSTGGERIPAVICIDVEPDPRSLDLGDRADWAGFERTFEDFGRFRVLLERATRSPVRFAWFLRMDPQIEQVYASAAWVASRYRREIRAIEEAGDALGLHIHPWRWDGSTRSWFADFADRAWGEHCVRLGFTAFARHFGRPCRMVRFGDRWLSDHVLGLSEKLGARYDLTAEPGRGPAKIAEPSVGSTPDYSSTPRHPYRPSRRNHHRPGTWFPRRLCMVPLSTGRLDWALHVLEERAARRNGRRNGAEESTYEGWIDRADGEAVAGWVCDRTRPDRIVEIEVHDGDRCIAVLPAGLYRPDLADAGLGSGRHAFLFPIADRLRDGGAHAIRVRASGTDFELRGGPAVLSRQPGESPVDDYRNLDLGGDSSILCALFEALLTTHPVGCLVLVVRSSTSVSEDMRGNVEQSLAYVAAHPRSPSLAFVPPVDAVAMRGVGRRRLGR
jgi:hypothetical protein